MRLKSQGRFIMLMRKSQSTIEYAVFIGVIVTALIGMSLYLRRSFQGRYREKADEIASQYDPQHTRGFEEISTNSVTNSVLRESGTFEQNSKTRRRVLRDETVEAW